MDEILRPIKKIQSVLYNKNDRKLMKNVKNMREDSTQTVNGFLSVFIEFTGA